MAAINPEIFFDDPILKVHAMKILDSAKKTSSCLQAATDDIYLFRDHQKMIADYFAPETNRRALLCLHGTGTGKTSLAIAVAQRYIDAGMKPVYVFLPKSSESSFMEEIWSEHKVQAEKFPGQLRVTGTRYDSVSDMLRDYEIISYTSLMAFVTRNENDLKQIFKNKLIIMDEIHSLRDPAEAGLTARNKAMAMILESLDRTRLLALSATPIYNKIVEINALVSLFQAFDRGFGIEVPEADRDDRSPEVIKKTFYGRISYIELDGPDFPSMHFTNTDVYRAELNGRNPVYNNISTVNSILPLVKCTLVGMQADKIKKDSRNYVGKSFLILDPVNNVFKNTIYVEKNLFRGKRHGHIRTSFPGILASMSPIGKTPYELEQRSAKLSKMFKNIFNPSRPKGSVFIYCESLQLISYIAALLDTCGYRNFSNGNGVLDTVLASPDIESIVHEFDADTREIYKENRKQRKAYAIISGDKSPQERTKILDIQRSEENATGEKIEIIIGSRVLSESITLAGIREVHIISPEWNMATINQIIGRAKRYCSHKYLPRSEWDIVVFIYCAHDTEYLTPDEYRYRQLAEKYIEVYQTLELFKELSFDCSLTKNRELTCLIPGISDTNKVASKSIVNSAYTDEMVSKLIMILTLDKNTAYSVDSLRLSVIKNIEPYVTSEVLDEMFSRALVIVMNTSIIRNGTILEVVVDGDLLYFRPGLVETNITYVDTLYGLKIQKSLPLYMDTQNVKTFKETYDIEESKEDKISSMLSIIAEVAKIAKTNIDLRNAAVAMAVIINIGFNGIRDYLLPFILTESGNCSSVEYTYIKEAFPDNFTDMNGNTVYIETRSRLTKYFMYSNKEKKIREYNDYIPERPLRLPIIGTDYVFSLHKVSRVRKGVPIYVRYHDPIMWSDDGLKKAVILTHRAKQETAKMFNSLPHVSSIETRTRIIKLMSKDSKPRLSNILGGLENAVREMRLNPELRRKIIYIDTIQYLTSIRPIKGKRMSIQDSIRSIDSTTKQDSVVKNTGDIKDVDDLFL